MSDVVLSPIQILIVFGMPLIPAVPPIAGAITRRRTLRRPWLYAPQVTPLSYLVTTLSYFMIVGPIYIYFGYFSAPNESGIHVALAEHVESMKVGIFFMLLIAVPIIVERWSAKRWTKRSPVPTVST